MRLELSMIKYRVSCVLGQSLQGSFNTGTSVTNSEFSIKDCPDVIVNLKQHMETYRHGRGTGGRSTARMNKPDKSADTGTKLAGFCTLLLLVAADMDQNLNYSSRFRLYVQL